MGFSLDEKHVMKTVWNEHGSQRWNERQNLSCLLMATAAARDLLSFKTLGLENRRGRGNRITTYSNVTSQCLLYSVINSLQALSYLCYCPLNSNPSFQHSQRYLSTTCLSHLPMKTLFGLREKPTIPHCTPKFCFNFYLLPHIVRIEFMVPKNRKDDFCPYSPAY